MVFHLNNFIYIGVWWFVALSYFVGYLTDDYCPYYEGTKKINLGKFSILFIHNKESKYYIWIVSFLIELGSYLLLLTSIVFIIISSFGDRENAIFLLSLYSVIAFVYLLVSGIIMTIYRGR